VQGMFCWVRPLAQGGEDLCGPGRPCAGPRLADRHGGFQAAASDVSLGRLMPFPGPGGVLIGLLRSRALPLVPPGPVSFGPDHKTSAVCSTPLLLRPGPTTIGETIGMRGCFSLGMHRACDGVGSPGWLERGPMAQPW